MSFALPAQPLILTLKLERHAFDVLDTLRKRHFPVERNFLSAHVTMFHKLPGEHEDDISRFLQTFSARSPLLHLSFPRVRFLGKVVAVEIESHELIKLGMRLVDAWDTWLTAQDRQGFRPHVTIQNKVAPDVARKLYDSLADSWQPLSARGEALQLWRYLGAPWRLLEEFEFDGEKVSQVTAAS